MDGLSYSNGDVACCGMFASWIPARVLLPLLPLSPRVLVTQLLLSSWLWLKWGGGVLRAETILASLTFKSSPWQPGAGVGLGLADEWAEGADHTQGGLLRRGQDVRV